MYKKFFKRLFDITFAIIGLPFLFIVLIIIGPIIYMQDKGPIFYNASRLGKKGKVFKMYKFRSMKQNSPDIRNKDGSTFNAEDDPRLTKIGTFLRKTSIDEIPQILNVIKGDMSIIGPRPDLPGHYLLYSEKEKRKLEIRPGITGYNQAYFRNTIPWEKRIQNDVYYIEHLSFCFDLRIFFKTIISVSKCQNIFVSKKDTKNNVKIF